MSRTRTELARCRRGQSTLEFALSLVFLIGFTLFFVQLSVLFAMSSYVHYATFMAARAYLSAGPDPSDQQDRARVVIVQTLKRSESLPGVDRWPAFVKGQGGADVTGLSFNGGEYDPASGAYSWAAGIRYAFRGRLIVIPMVGSGSVNTVGLTSESYLGREASYSECKSEIQSRQEGIFDNGC